MTDRAEPPAEDDDALEALVLECLDTPDPDAMLVTRLQDRPTVLARARRLLAQMARLERLDAGALLDRPTPRADDRSTWPQVPGVELQALVGRGGQGFVFRGRQSYLDRDVAVKVLAPELQTPEFVARFRREARLLAGLQHPNVVACYDAGVDEAGRCRLVMEWVDGPNLRQHLDRHGKLSWREAARLADELAQALGCAHAAGLVHRDVKPENVLLQPTAGGPRAKLADLGLARPRQRRDDASLLTPAGAVLGTPITMAPEQFDDPENAGPRADLYGLGCVLHHALTGEPAFAGSGLSELVLAKAALRGPKSRTPIPEAPRALSDLVWRLLAFDAADRPADGDEVRRALAEVLAESPRRPRRRTLHVAAAALLVAASGAAWWQWRTPTPPPLTLAAPNTVVEGGLGTLAWSRPNGEVLPAVVTQLAGPRVRFVATNPTDAQFAIPLGAAFENLQFRIDAEGTESRVCTIHVQPAAERTLAPSAAEDLFPGGTLGRWRGTEPQRWQPDESARGVLGNAPRGRTTLQANAPLGSWTLQGSIEPRYRYVSPEQPRVPIAAVTLRIELGAWDAVALQVAPAKEGSFVARWLVERRDDDDWREVRELTRTAGAFDAEGPLAIDCSWDNASLCVGWRGGETTARVERRELPDGSAPGRLELSIDRGVAVFTDWQIRKP